MDIITSGALLHLDVRNENILSDYLTLVLNSIVAQLQAERDSNVAIIQHWKTDDIKKIIVCFTNANSITHRRKNPEVFCSAKTKQKTSGTGKMYGGRRD